MANLSAIPELIDGYYTRGVSPNTQHKDFITKQTLDRYFGCLSPGFIHASSEKQLSDLRFVIDFAFKKKFFDELHAVYDTSRAGKSIHFLP
jgi:ribosome-associated toxin RatA of RatAB toxin-antitoxin module